MNLVKNRNGAYKYKEFIEPKYTDLFDSPSGHPDWVCRNCGDDVACSEDKMKNHLLKHYIIVKEWRKY